MADAGFFRGTSAEQDNRFSDKQKKLMRQMKFPDNLLRKVDTSKINLDAIRPWVSKRLQEILRAEDEVLVEFVIEQLAQKDPDGRSIQINLTGFLNSKMAREFMAELWDLLLAAQEKSNSGGDSGLSNQDKISSNDVKSSPPRRSPFRSSNKRSRSPPNSKSRGRSRSRDRKR